MQGAEHFKHIDPCDGLLEVMGMPDTPIGTAPSLSPRARQVSKAPPPRRPFRCKHLMVAGDGCGGQHPQGGARDGGPGPAAAGGLQVPPRPGAAAGGGRAARGVPAAGGPRPLLRHGPHAELPHQGEDRGGQRPRRPVPCSLRGVDVVALSSSE